MASGVDFGILQNVPRLLIEVDLQPIQGTRFQPTGFPDLGAATYQLHDGTEMLVVESAQSMANRLEAVCWDSVELDWVGPLKGLPYVKVMDDGVMVTCSILEAHRLNSEYIARTKRFLEIAKDLQYEKDKPFDIIRRLVPFLLKYDINSLLHGVFLEEIAGVIRLPRTLSAFIEAMDVKVVPSGGVKINRVEPGLKEGEGNVIYGRQEYAASRIIAYFNLDLAQIRSFGLGTTVENLLIALAFFKIHRFLETGLRLRTACDLEVKKTTLTRPETFQLPELKKLIDELPALIKAVTSEGKFAKQPVTVVSFKGEKA
ncbi:MAG: type I-U CRISPR-associated protein Cas7 [Nitrospira sp.]|nr:MAG: type I-U CRISPR-associated protein Cas7 [Nitrospira sp.]